MSRLLNSTAAIVACAFVTTGCASMGMDSSASKPAAKQAAASDTAPNTSDEADASYDKLIAGLPHNLDGAIRRAQLLRSQGDLKGAIHSLSQLMLVAPDDPRVVGEYGKVLAQQGRSNDALAFLKRAVELQPDNWSFYSALGVTYDQLDDHAKAEDAYKHALALKPDNAVVLNNYAMSQMLAGNLDHADALLQRAAAAGGNNPEIADNLKTVTAMRAKQASMDSDSAVKPQAVTASAKKTAHPAAKPAKTAAAKTAAPKVVAETDKPHLLMPAHVRKANAPAGVVMQKVPHDPLAGKVYGHSQLAQAKTASTPEHVAEADTKPAKQAKVPALRTSTDLY